MILANVAAAETLERAQLPLIYRVHDEPDPERVNALREFLQSLDISLPKGGTLKADQFNRILAQVKGRDVEKLVNEVVLRTQAQAEYAAENYGHFGLNLRRYAHFTSPIRLARPGGTGARARETRRRRAADAPTCARSAMAARISAASSAP
jgi:ribonuclease R